MRLLRLLIAVAAVAGAAFLLKRLLEEQTAAPESTAPEATSEATPRPDPSSSAGPSDGDRTAASAGRGSDNGGEPTKAELYERAQELGIEGRSKMSKRELQRAIEAAG